MSHNEFHRLQMPGEGVSAPLQPSGVHRAPSNPIQPRQVRLVAKGGGIQLEFVPAVAANLDTAYTNEQATQPEFTQQKLG